MSKQESDVDYSQSINNYPIWVFYLSFSIIAVEVATLITSNVWAAAAPEWSTEIFDKKRELLALAAAVTLLLALMLAFRPAGLAKYAALGSGVISFAAAASFEVEQPTTAAAMLGLISPFYIVYFPVIRFPQTWPVFIHCCTITGFFSLATMVVMLSIPLLQIRIFLAEFNSFVSFLVWSAGVGIMMTSSIIVTNLFIQLTGQWYENHSNSLLHKTIRSISRRFKRTMARQQGNRSARRRATRDK